MVPVGDGCPGCPAVLAVPVVFVTFLLDVPVFFCFLAGVPPSLSEMIATMLLGLDSAASKSLWAQNLHTHVLPLVHLVPADPL